MTDVLQKAKDRLMNIYNYAVALGDLNCFTYYGMGFLDGHSPFFNYNEMKELGKFYYELVEKWNNFEKKED